MQILAITWDRSGTQAVRLQSILSLIKLLFVKKRKLVIFEIIKIKRWLVYNNNNRKVPGDYIAYKSQYFILLYIFR